jgi:Ulp1 family protease
MPKGNCITNFVKLIAFIHCMETSCHFILLHIKLVGQQKNGFDCGVYCCMFSAVMFLARDITVIYVTTSNALLETLTTSNCYFNLTQEDCDQFQTQLHKLLQWYMCPLMISIPLLYR